MRLPVRLAALGFWFASSLLALAGADAPNVASTAFSPRPAEPSTPRFTTLPSSETGIGFANAYADPAMWSERYEEFAFGSVGTGVAMADYDGDGRPDLYLVGKSDRSRLYRNLGNWRFEDVTDAAGLTDAPGVWKQGATFADVDNDGDLDLYVCRSRAPNLLYLNQGTGTFKEAAQAAGLDLVDASVMAAFQDYDRDGWLDVYVQTSLLDPAGNPHGQRDRLYHNRGDGTFEEVTDRARIFAPTQGHASTWWDSNEDGWPDLYVDNDFVTPDQLYLNDRRGAFVEKIDASVPYFPYFAMGADLGDVNNDGRLDLFVADMLPTSRRDVHRTMMNMQAKMAINLPPTAAAQYMRNMLYLSTGTGRFQEAAQMAGLRASDWTWSARFEDLDEDGRVDLHITNGMVRDFFDADFLAKVNQLPPPERKRLVQAAPELRQHNLMFQNGGDLTFKEVGRDWGLDHLGISFGAAFGDLDGDGDLDLVFSNYQGEATVCRNESAAHHHAMFDLRGKASNRFGIGAELRVETKSGTQVRRLGAARGYLSSSEPALHFGLGAAENIERLTIRWPNGESQVLENLAADRRYTIEESASPAPAAPPSPTPQFEEVSRQIGLALEVNEQPVDEFAAQRLLPWRQQAVGPSLAVTDVDGDKVDDVLVGGVAGQPVRLLTPTMGRFLPGGNPVLARAAETSDAGIVCFDANGDGEADLLIAKGGVNRPAGDAAYQPRLLYGRGSGYFDPAPEDAVPALPTSAGPVAVADFDRDGQLDVFIGGRVVAGAYPATPRSVVLRNQQGRFTDTTDALAPGLAAVGLVQSALWTDVDGDGWLDLLVATHWGGVRCWRNREGKKFEDATEALGFSAAGHGWWNSIAAADFNGDGKLDYAVGNLGLNTRYHASAAEPVVLLAGDFDRNGRRQLIEAETLNGELVPMRARDSVIGAIRSLQRTAPTYSAYANVSVEKLLGAERLAAAERHQVTETRSGVFLSSTAPGQTGYTFAPLPRSAQIAPVLGIAAGDFDGDGRADLYVVQNLHTPHPEIGRFGGGVSEYLHGDGHGNFQSVVAAESGLLVPGEARALAVSDLNADGWPDFIVSRQDAPVLAFVNRHPSSGSSFAVRLNHAAPNTKAVGARVTVVSADGSRQTAEVHAGGGYLSQSTSDLFFGYRDDRLPKAIRVRWPDGRETEHAFVAGTKLMAISGAAR